MSFSIALTPPAAIANLDELKSVVADWLDRDDLEDRIPVFIGLAEAWFNRRLRTPEMETTITFSAINEDTPFPASDYLSMRSIYCEASPDRPLRAMAPTALRQQYSGASGIPTAYCLVGGGIRLVPPPSDEVLLTMDYYARITALSVESPSNWLLEQHPEAYLYGTLYFAEAMLDNATRAGQWKQLCDEILAGIQADASANRYGAGPLVPNTVQQVRGSRC